MATAPEPTTDELNRQSARLEAETRKLVAEAEKLKAEEYKLLAEQSKLARDKSMAPWLIVVQALLAGAALFGAALAYARFVIG